MNQDQLNKKLAAFRAELDARGEPISDYCRRMGLDYDAMHAVLKGRSKGKRGEAHRVFVALGLKPSSAA